MTPAKRLMCEPLIRDNMIRSTVARYIVGLLVIPAVVALLGTTASAAANDAAVRLPAATLDAPLASARGEETAVFAGGCFWGIEAVFEHVKGVKSAVSGYTGGRTVNPSYSDIGTGTTGHAEAVSVVYDPSQVTYGQLLRIFFSVAHDPTQLNRQGPDAGTQYRSAIFYRTNSQQQIATAYVAQLSKGKFFRKPIVTQLAQLGKFTVAEEYHQNYAAANPESMYIMVHDAPKVANLKKTMKEFYRDTR